MATPYRPDRSDDGCGATPRRRGWTWHWGVTLYAVACVGCGDAASDMSPPADTRTVQPPPARLRRLSSREYNNVVRDLLGDTSRPADRFVVDSYQNGYDNGSAGLVVQADQAMDYARAAEALAQTAVASRLGRLLDGCSLATQGPDACLSAFLHGLAARAFRRPLHESEEARLRALFQTEIAGPDGFSGAISTLLEVILQSPQFLYREELGARNADGAIAGDAAAARTVELSDYEVASELSFLLTGSLPDATLWTAVGQGRFHTAADRRREASRLLATPAARESLRTFLHAWLGTDALSDLSKDKSFYPTFTASLSASMRGELDRYYDARTWGDRGSLRDLFTSPQSYVDRSLADLYGVAVPTDTDGAGFGRSTLDATVRPGILGRAGFLAVHAATDSSGPVSRGVYVLQSILCMPPPQPPASVPPVVPASDPIAAGLTTRQRFERHVADPFCRGCHARIDGVGFGFEQFDGIGAFRTQEQGQPVDARGQLLGVDDGPADYRGVAELAPRLASSPRLADCFLRQAYRYTMGQIEGDSDTLGAVVPDFSTEARMVDVLLRIVEHPIFVTRTLEPDDAAPASSHATAGGRP